MLSVSDGPGLDLPRLIGVLNRHEVEYVLVGGVAATAYGAERETDDADCVVRRERANLERLAAALRDLHARLRIAHVSDEEAKQLIRQQGEIDGEKKSLGRILGGSPHLSSLSSRRPIVLANRQPNLLQCCLL